MMRTFLSALILMMLSAAPATCSAEEPLTIWPVPSTSGDAGGSLPEVSYRRMSLRQERVFRRAAREARDRAARIQLRRWSGGSAQRPVIRPVLSALDLSPYGAWSWSGTSVRIYHPPR